jgi:chemotaxis protein MotB
MSDESRPRIIVRKKKGHAAHHGGAWKVAYADFVTAMMAFFMVMWLLTQADLKLRSEIARYFRSPGILSGGAAINEEPSATASRQPKVVNDDVVVVQGDGEEQLLKGQAKQIEETLKEAAKQDPTLAALKEQVLVQVTDEGLLIQVIDKGRTLLFDLSSAELKPAVVAVLQRVAPLLGKLPNHIQVGGHTDSRPFPAGSAMTNWELSFRRADAARRVMEATGTWPGQINRVLSFADTAHLLPDQPFADENRRLSILAVREHPSPRKHDDPQDDGPVVLPPDLLPNAETPPG